MSLRRILAACLVAALALVGGLMLRDPDFLPALAPARPPPEGRIDRIVIEKSARRLLAIRDGDVVREYRVALGFAPEGDKARQGDGRTPEGVFRIDRRNPGSAFHLSLGIDYPQPDDIARARDGGYDPGGDIFIHGQPNRLAGLVTIPYDWTAGCIALSDSAIEELWRLAPVGTVVEIRP